jgi:hypothetical protein
MSNHKNHRRGHAAIQDHGPAYESHTPAAGCNSTHVARARTWWKKLRNQSLRRNGAVSKHFWSKPSLVALENVEESDV